MRETKLILLEGIPGSGKSTMAQTLLRDLAAQSIAARWRYEEEVGHPDYMVGDRASLHAVLTALSTGRYRAIVDRVIDQWRAIADALRTTEQVVLPFWVSLRLPDLEPVPPRRVHCGDPRLPGWHWDHRVLAPDLLGPPAGQQSLSPGHSDHHARPRWRAAPPDRMPLWYGLVRMGVSAVQVGLAVWMLHLYQRHGVWAAGTSARRT